jgi:TP901 family phage tail tape measure protein
MASAFNLTAQINLRGPANLKAVVSSVKKEFSGITTKIDLKIDPRAEKSIESTSKKMKDLANAIKLANTNASILNTTLSSLSSKVQTVTTALNNSDRILDRLNKSSRKLGSSLRSTTNEFEEFGRQGAISFRRLGGTALVTAGFYKMIGAISSAASSFIELDRQMIKIQQVTGTTKEGVKALEVEITNLSVSLGLEADSLAKTSVILAQAGLTADQTRLALKALAKTELAPSFENIEKTTEGAIASMRQFGIGAEDLEKALGSINAVAARFAVESGDIIAAIQRTGGVFASASKGVSEGQKALEEFISVFTSIRATTRESGEGIATGLRTILTRVQRSSTVEQLKNLGIELRDSEGKFIGAYKAVEALATGLKNLDPRSQAFSKIVEELGGFRQIGKVIPLIQQFSTAQEALKVATQGQDSLTAAQEKAQGSLAVRLAKVRAEFNALFKEVAQNRAFQVLTDLVIGFSSVILSLGRTLKGLAPILGILGVIKGVQAIKSFGTGFFGELTKNKGGLPQATGSRTSPSTSGSGEKQILDALSKASDATKLNTSAITQLTKVVTDLKSRIDRAGTTLGFARGGVVPGSGNRDTVPAMLTPGEFVIRKDAVKALGTEKLHKMNKYNDGGEAKRLLGQDAVGAAVLQEGSRDSFIDSGSIVSASKASDEEKNRLENIVKGKSFKFPARGLKPNFSNFIDDAIKTNTVTFINNMSKSFDEKFQGMQLSPAKINKDQIKNFMTSVNDGLRGSLYEAFITNIEKAGKYEKSTADQRNAPFDLTNGITKGKDLYEDGLDGIDFIDLKATLEAASVPSLAKKIGNTLLKDTTLGTGTNLSSTNSGSSFIGTVLDVFRELGVDKRRNIPFYSTKGKSQDKTTIRLVEKAYEETKAAGFVKNIEEFDQKLKEEFDFHKTSKTTPYDRWSGEAKKFAKGGYSKDTVPAMLTPGEFVINKKAAASIGSAQLHRMNKADKVQGFNKGGPVGFVQRFSTGGDVFDVLREESGRSVKGFTTQLRKELTNLALSISKSLKQSQRDFVIDAGKSRQRLAAGGNKKSIRKDLKSSLSSVAASAGIADPAMVNKAVRDVMKGFKDGLSISEIKASSTALAQILDAQISDQEALNRSVQDLAESTGIAADKLEDIASIDDLKRQKFKETDLGKQFGMLGSESFAKSRLGGALSRSSRVFEKAPGGAVGIGAGIAASSAIFSEGAKKLSKELGLTISSSPVLAGISQSLQSAGSTGATGAAIGQTLGGAPGAMIGLLLGTIAGGIDGFFSGLNDQKITNSLTELGKSSETLERVFRQLEDPVTATAEALNQAQTAFGERLIESQKLDTMGSRPSTVTAGDVGAGALKTTAFVATGALLGAATAAKIGAAIGTAIAPGVGTAIGALVGLGAGLAYSYANNPSSQARDKAAAARIGSAPSNMESQVRFNQLAFNRMNFDELSASMKELETKGSGASETVKNYVASTVSAIPNFEKLTASQQEKIKADAAELAAIDAWIDRKKKQGVDEKLINEELINKRKDVIEEGQKYIVEMELVDRQTILNTKATSALGSVLADLSAKFNKIGALAKNFSSSLSLVEKSLKTQLDNISGENLDGASIFYEQLVSKLENVDALSIDQYRQATAQATAGQGQAGVELSQAANIGKALDESLNPFIRRYANMPTEDINPNDISNGIIQLIGSVLPGDIDENLVSTVINQFTAKLEAGVTDLDELSQSFSGLFPAAKDAEQAILAMAQAERDASQTEQYLRKEQNALLLESSSLRRQEVKILRDGRLNYLRATGQNVSLDESVGGFDEQIKIMTQRLIPGGTTDAGIIGGEIRDRQERNRQLMKINQDLAANRANDPRAVNTIKTNETEINNNLLAIREGNDALKEIANNTDASSAALEKIRDQQERDKVGVNYLDKIFGGTISDQLDIGMDLQTVLKGVRAAQTGQTQPFADPRFYSTFMGSEALQMFTKEQQSFLRTFARTAAAQETGGVQMARAAYQMSINAETGRADSPEAKMYNELINNQLRAVNELSLQNQTALNLVATTLEAKLQDIVNQIRQIATSGSQQVQDNTNRGSRIVPPLGRRSGGIIYASEGTLVDYEPRGTDTVPAMLTPGEFVVNAQATKKNRALLESINQGNTTYASKGGIIYAAKGGMGVENPYAAYSEEDLEEASKEAHAKQWFYENNQGSAKIPRMASRYAWFTPGYGSMNQEQKRKVIDNNIKTFQRFDEEFKKIRKEKEIDLNGRDPNAGIQSVNLFNSLEKQAREERELIEDERASRSRRDPADLNRLENQSTPSSPNPSRVFPHPSSAAPQLTSVEARPNLSKIKSAEARPNLSEIKLAEWLYSEMVKDMTRDSYDMSAGSNPGGLNRYYKNFFQDKLKTNFPLIGNLNGEEILYNWAGSGTSDLRVKAIQALEQRILDNDKTKRDQEDDRITNKIKADSSEKQKATGRDNLLYEVYNAGHAWTDAQMVAKSKKLGSMQFRSMAGSPINGHIVGLGDAPLVLTDVRGNGDRPELRPSAGQAQLSIRKLGDNEGFGGIIPVRLEQLDDDTLRATLKYFQEQTLEQEEANQERTDSALAASKAQSKENKRRAEELTYQRRHWWGLDPEAWFDQRSGQIDLPGGRGRGLSFKKPFGPSTNRNPYLVDDNQDMGRVNPMLGIDINQPIQAYDYGAPTIDFNPSPSLPPLVPSLRDQADNIRRGGTTGLPGSGTENRGPNVAPIIAGGNTYQRLPDDILLTQGLPRELVDIYQQVYSDKDGYPISLRPTENSWQKGVDRFIHQPLETASKDLWESGNGLTSFFPAALNFAAGLALDSPTYSPGYVGEFENGTKLVIPSDSDVPLAVDLGLGIIANRIASISRLRSQARALDTANERALALGEEAPFYPPAIRPDATTPPIRPEITPQTTAESAGIFPDLFSPAPGSRITIGTNEINDVVFGPGNLQAIDPNTGRLARGSVDVNGNPSGGHFPTQGQRSGGLPVYDPNTGSFSTQLRTPAQEFNPLPFESFPSNIDTVTSPRVIDSPGSTRTIDVFPSQVTPRVAVTPPISGNVRIAPSPNSVRTSLAKRGLSPLVKLDDGVARRIYQDFVEQGGVGSESATKWLRFKIDSLNNAAIKEGIGPGVKVVDLDPRPVTSPDIMNNQPVTPSERTGFYSNTTPASATAKPSVKPDISKPLMDYEKEIPVRPKPVVKPEPLPTDPQVLNPQSATSAATAQQMDPRNLRSVNGQTPVKPLAATTGSSGPTMSNQERLDALGRLQEQRSSRRRGIFRRPSRRAMGGIIYAQDGGLTKNLFNEVRGVGSTNPDAIYRFDPSVPPDMQKYFLKDKGYPVELRTRDGSLDRFKTSSISNFLLDSGATAPAIDAVYEDGTIVKNLGDPGDMPIVGDLLTGGGALAFRKLAKLRTLSKSRKSISQAEQRVMDYIDSGRPTSTSLDEIVSFLRVENKKPNSVLGTGPYEEALSRVMQEEGGSVLENRGRWFFPAKEDYAQYDLDFYKKSKGPNLEDVVVKQLDLPRGLAERFRLSHPSMQDSILGSQASSTTRFKEFVFPKEIAAQARNIDPKALEAMGLNFKNKGGVIYADQGMLVPYQPKGTDTVPAMLTPGEFVVNRRATQDNLPLLQNINSGVSYLEDGGFLGRRNRNRNQTSSVQETTIGFDITKFQEGTNTFNKGITNFTSQVKVFDATIGNFGSYVTRLEKIKLPSIPDKIEMFGTHKVDVNVTGAAAFEAIDENVRKLIDTKIGEKWNELWLQSNGELGSPRR